MQMSNLLQNIEKSELGRGIILWWLGGASWVLRTPSIILYIDLFTGPAPTETLTPLTKNYKDLIDPNNVSIADAVLSTHVHIDHCHKESLLPIYRNTSAIFIGGPSSVKHFRNWNFAENRIVELEPYQFHKVVDATITALPNRDCVDTGAVSYLIDTSEVSLFDGGDTLYFEGLRDIGKKWHIDIALLNFFKNPPEIDMTLSMTPKEVASAALDLNAKFLIPKHWNIWTELEDDPQKISDELQDSPVKTKILEPGQEFIYLPD
jgi:L-ascorbate 6-phosphate lactonase